MLARFAGGTAALCIFLAALAGSGAARAEAPVALRIAFPTTPNTAILPHFVAEDLGWFDKAGLKIDDIWMSGDANAVRALMSGNADLAYVGTFTVYSAILRGAKIKAIGSGQAIVDHLLIARAPFKKLADLAGAIIAAGGVGSITSEIPRLVLEKNGIDTSNLKYIVIGSADGRLQALLGGKVDATIAGMLYLKQAMRHGTVNVLASIPEVFPGLGYAYMVAKEEDLAKPALHRAFESYVRYGIVEGSRFIMKHPDQSAVIMQKHTPDLDLDLVKATVEGLNGAKVWGVNGGLDPEVTAFTQHLAAQMHAIDREVPVDAVIDRSLVEAVLQDEGRM